MHFQPDLQERAADFLRRTIPPELQPDYVAGSLAEIVIGHCAQDKGLDPELCEIAEISAGEYDDAIAKAKTAELREYYAECQHLLQEIIRAAS